MLRKNTWVRKCRCAYGFKIYLYLWMFLTYFIMTFMNPMMGFSFDIFQSFFWIVAGVAILLVIYMGMRLVEDRCDALGHGVSSQEDDTVSTKA